MNRLDTGHLSEDELQSVLSRAQSLTTEDHELAPFEAFVQAAQEAGIPRDAVVQALRERLASRPEIIPGQLVYAPSTDDFLYIARVQRIQGDIAYIQFVSGAETAVAIHLLQPFAPLPNQKVDVHMPSYGGWYAANVLNFNPQIQSLSVNMWGSTSTVTLDCVRIRSKLKPNFWETHRGLVTQVAIAAAGLGTTLGFILAKIISR